MARTCGAGAYYNRIGFIAINWKRIIGAPIGYVGNVSIA